MRNTIIYIVITLLIVATAAYLYFKRRKENDQALIAADEPSKQNPIPENIQTMALNKELQNQIFNVGVPENKLKPLIIGTSNTSFIESKGDNSVLLQQKTAFANYTAMEDNDKIETGLNPGLSFDSFVKQKNWIKFL